MLAAECVGDPARLTIRGNGLQNEVGRQARMIPILPETAWLEFRGAGKPGQNLTCHQALIQDSNGQEHKCYVKAAPQGSPMPFTEAVGWLVADALDLPRPKFAALLLLPVPKLGRHLKLDQHWLGYTHALAFCTSTVEGKHVASRWRWLAQLRKVQAFRHPDVARIAAFDQWVENRDRHTGNFLRTRSGAYVPIDNEYILFSIIWAASVAVAHQSLRNEARTALTSAGFLKFEAAMVIASQLHHSALQTATPSVQRLVSVMHPDQAEGVTFAAAILQFLGQRAHPEWLANELGHIV